MTKCFVAGLRRMVLLLVVVAWGCAAIAAETASPMERGFQQPPEQTKPWCYWYWISDNISKEGITRDLESMARVGIGEALIGNIFLDDIPAGKVKVLSEEWWSLVEHAIREAGRVGVNIGMFNCPGWSQSGGPWIKPEQSMRYLVSSELRVKGPVRLNQDLPNAPKTPFQDVALLAFPVPEKDADTIATHAPRLTSQPAAADVAKMIDGKLETICAFPAGAGQGNNVFTVELEVGEPFTARSLSLVPGKSAWAGNCELQVGAEDGRFEPVRSFKFDRSNMEIGVGPMPQGPVTVSFPAVTSKRFRLAIKNVSGGAALAEINLTSAARVESFVEKQLGKMHPTPLPMWDTYLWPQQPEPDSASLSIAPGKVIDLSGRVSAEGKLRWDVPAGEWIILRTGMTPTGTRNAPASPEGQGLEVDKMNRAAARHHFDAFIGQLVKRMPFAERRAFKHVVADSYEMGSQNWTDGFARTFQKRYGYDPKPWLPVLTGRVVGGAGQSDRFLWDLRRLVADHVATDYVGGLRDLCHPHGLQLWLENYGHWGFPAEFLQYGGQSDRIGGEFWVTGDLGSIECRAASSAGNTYGKPITSAEAFTGGPAFQTVPSSMKARGDWAFCEGINHFVLHVYIQQPWEDRVPGVNAWFGTEFNRHNTWFEPGKAWMDYLRRCSFLLQQGTRVADAAYFIGEDAPKMTGLRKPELPAGRDFDYINAEVILKKLTVRNGLLTLPHGTTYRVLVLPEQSTMRPEVLKKIGALVKAGATVVGPPPFRSPSLEGYPKCDEEVQELAREVWGDLGHLSAGERSYGKGRVIRGKNLDVVFARLDVAADFLSSPKLRYTHRAAEDTDIYFVANPQPQAVTAKATFRVTGRVPELWWPDSGRVERPAVYEAVGDTVRMPLQLGPQGSVFVVFREKVGRGSSIVSVQRNETVLMDTKWALPASVEPGASTGNNNFTMALWVKPGADTTLVRETNKGVHGMAEPRNDALFPPHGNTFGDGNHAGSGLAVGRNGVCVFEHAGNYFAPVLVHAAPITNWTHVAVVYRDGQPSVYLNGELARTGLKSDYIVHPGATSQSAGSPQFRGEMGMFEVAARALSDAEVAGLVKSMPQPSGRTGVPIELTRGAGNAIEGWAWEPGDYRITTELTGSKAGIAGSFARTVSVPVKEVPAPIELKGAWEVSFDPKWGGPEKATFEKLMDWTEHSAPGIKHYSGKAVYRQSFEMPASLGAKRLVLDLGNVRDLATVRVNGKALGTLWLAPWTIDVTAVLQPGRNTLEVEIVNAWNNRLVGDANRPAEQRRTFLAAKTVDAKAPLRPAGLLGPVVIRAAVPVKVPGD